MIVERLAALIRCLRGICFAAKGQRADEHPAGIFRIIEVGIKYPTRNRIRLDEYKILKLRRNHASDVQLILVSHQGYQKLGYNILSFFSFVGQPKLRSS